MKSQSIIKQILIGALFGCHGRSSSRTVWPKHVFDLPPELGLPSGGKPQGHTNERALRRYRSPGSL